MGERKGQNFYYPPDFDPKKHGSLNGYHGTHALRERAAKIHLGILIIRFEMPFNIWCLGCDRHVAMGVRYNAEKKKVGMYYTTPIYEFNMRCHLCENYFVIRTDPKNFDYELVSGLRRQEKRWDPSENDGFAPKDRNDKHKLAADAMFKLEHGEEDKKKAQDAVPQMERLEDLQGRMRDDFASNQALRRAFRTKKKEMQAQASLDSSLLKKSSLAIDLLPEDDNDKKIASMLSQYRTVKTVDERQDEARAEISGRSIFAKNHSEISTPSTSNSSNSSEKSSVVSKKQDKIAQMRKSIAVSVYKKRITDSSLSDFSPVKKGVKLVNSKGSKNISGSEIDQTRSEVSESTEDSKEARSGLAALVGYGSDSDQDSS